MEIERYSHVMHISSTVTGKLLPELGVWDVLRAALPAGTVSGAPKVYPFNERHARCELHIVSIAVYGMVRPAMPAMICGTCASSRCCCRTV